MSLLGYDSNGSASINGLIQMSANDMYSDDTYINYSTSPLNVGDELIRLQGEIDAIETELIAIGSGYYGLYASTNNATNPLAEKKLYYNQTIAQNGFSITGGTGLSATRITAAYDGLYTIWYKINYSKDDATTAYPVRTWLMKNGVDVDYTTTIQTMDTASQFMQVVNSWTISLNATDYLEVSWLSANANASSDILDFIAAASPYPQVSSQTVMITQVANTTSGHSDIITVGSTTTLAAGSPATVTDTTTIFPSYTEHTLAFGIPAGPQGTPGTNGINGTNGATGPEGPQGPKGDTGATGAKGDKGDTGDTNATATAALVLATATAASLTAYTISNNAEQAAQNGTLATHTGEITALEGDVTDLQVKTTDQSWGLLTGTTFSRRVNITNTGLAVGDPAIYLASSEAATFLYGLSATGAISSASTLTSTAGTSQMSSLLVNNNLELTNDAFITAGELYITRTLLGPQKKLVLYDNSTGNDYDYLGFWTDSGLTSRKFLNAEIDGNADSAFRWYYGDGLGLSRTLMKSLNKTIEDTYVETSNFCRAAGSTQEIQLTRISANNQVLINMLGDTAGINDYDGQIIQEQGNGVDNNRGLMTIQSGGVAINSLLTGISIQATSSAIFQSGTTMNITSGSSLTTTSTTGTQINSTLLDINASDDITIDTLETATITAKGITIECPTPGGTEGILIKTNDAGNEIKLTTLGLGSNIELRAEDASITLTTVGGGDNIILTSSSETEINCLTFDLNASTAATLDAPTITITSSGETEINSAAFDVNATGVITMDTDDPITITSTANGINLSSFGEQDITCGSLDVNSAGNITIDTPATTILTSEGITLECPLTSITGIIIKTNEAANDIDITTIGAGSDINLLSTAATITLTAATEADITCATLDLNASTAATLDAPTITTTSSGTTQINSAALDMNASGAVTIDTSENITLTSTNAVGNGAIRLNAGTGSDVTINGCNQFTITTETTTQPAIQHTSINTSSDDMRLFNNNRGTGYLMRLAETGTATGGLTLNGVNNGTNTIKSNGGASTLKLESANNILIDSVGSTQIDCDAGLDINSASTITIDAVSSINITSVAQVTIDSGTGQDLTITAGNDLNLDAVSDVNLTSGVGFDILLNSQGNLEFQASGDVRISVATQIIIDDVDLRIQQTNYAQPMSLDSQLGYTNTSTLTANALATTMTQERNWNLPSKGVWLVHATITLAGVSAANINYFEAVISLTTASATEAAAGLSYLQEQDETSGVTGNRLKISLSGVVTVSATTTLFLNARAQPASGGAPTIAASISWTRIG